MKRQRMREREIFPLDLTSVSSIIDYIEDIFPKINLPMNKNSFYNGFLIQKKLLGSLIFLKV